MKVKVRHQTTDKHCHWTVHKSKLQSATTVAFHLQLDLANLSNP